MANTSIAEQNPATPAEIWAILRETALRQKEHEAEVAKWHEEAKMEAVRRQEEVRLEAARRQEEARLEAARRQEEAKLEAVKRQKEAARWEKEAARREKEADRREKEADKRQKEADKRQKENEEYWAKSREEWAELKRQFAETKELFDQTDRKIQANNGEMGRLRNSFGEVIEHLVASGINERFSELGMDFGSGKGAANMEIKVGGKVVTEADIWLENDQTILVVEVKAKVKARDVGKHKERLDIIRKVQDGLGDGRRILGAIAGAVFESEQRAAAIKAGFFVMAQSGDTMKMDVPEGFTPREW